MREMRKRKMILGLVWKKVMVFFFFWVVVAWPYLLAFVFKTLALPMLYLCPLLFIVCVFDSKLKN